ncbi:MAG: ComEA family DNA-binding protein [Bryobacteraceae bacterium]
MRVWFVVLAAGPAMAQASLPEGPGKKELVRLCKGCHELGRSYSVRQDRTGWEETMAKMAAIGVKGKPGEMDAILEYLVKYFPADELPPVNVNKARAIELESRLSLPRSQAALIIAHREKHGPFRSIEELKKVPGLDAKRIEDKKDRLVF